MSSSYLLQGPRVGRRERSIGWRGRGRGMERGRESGREGESARETENELPALSEETMTFLLSKFPDLLFKLTISNILDVSLNFFQAFINVVEGGESDVSLNLSPGGNLVDGPLRTLDLGWFHRRRSGKLVLLLISMLRKMLHANIDITTTLCTSFPLTPPPSFSLPPIPSPSLLLPFPLSPSLPLLSSPLDERLSLNSC